MGRQYEKIHATTVEAPQGVELKAWRFVGLDGNYAAGTGGIKRCVGISESDTDQCCTPVVTGYSCVIELEVAVAKGDYLKPGTDGKAVKGTATDHCATARYDGQAGGFVEAEILKHVYP